MGGVIGDDPAPTEADPIAAPVTGAAVTGTVTPATGGGAAAAAPVSPIDNMVVKFSGKQTGALAEISKAKFKFYKPGDNAIPDKVRHCTQSGQPLGTVVDRVVRQGGMIFYAELPSSNKWAILGRTDAVRRCPLFLADPSNGQNGTWGKVSALFDTDIGLNDNGHFDG